jgi:hypothetical protein
MSSDKQSASSGLQHVTFSWFGKVSFPGKNIFCFFGEICKNSGKNPLKVVSSEN